MSGSGYAGPKLLTNGDQPETESPLRMTSARDLAVPAPWALDEVSAGVDASYYDMVFEEIAYQVPGADGLVIDQPRAVEPGADGRTAVDVPVGLSSGPIRAELDSSTAARRVRRVRRSDRRPAAEAIWPTVITAAADVTPISVPASPTSAAGQADAAPVPETPLVVAATEIVPLEVTTATASATATNTAAAATDTPVSDTATDTPAPATTTDTPTAATATATATNTVAPAATATQEPASISTPTGVPATSTPTATNVPAASTPTATSIPPTPTPTSAPAAATSTATAAATSTPAISAEAATATARAALPVNETVVPINTPTRTPTRTSTPTRTPTPAPPTPTRTPTPVPPTATNTAAAPPPTATAAAGTRDKFKQPFASTSIWNMPIGSGAVRVAANLRQPTQWGMFADENQIILTPDAPMTDVLYSSDAWNGGSRCTPDSGNRVMTRVPLPPSYTIRGADAGWLANYSGAILMPDQRTIVQTQPLTHCTTSSAWTTYTNWPSVDIYGDGIPGAHGGSGLSSIGGTIRVGELVPGGTIRHALKLILDSANYSSSNGGHRWPATTSDCGGSACGYSGNNAAVKMGTLLALPANFDVSTPETEPGRIVARAMLDYGGYIVDSGWDPWGLAVEEGPNGKVEDNFQRDFGMTFASQSRNTGWVRDMDRVFGALQVIDNNSASAVGGGGTPRVPLAPPIGN